MSDATRAEAPKEPTTVIEAQDAIAAAIPEIERLARKFFVIARDLQAPEQEDGFDEQEPGPEHLRWFTAAGAMAAYEGLLDLVPYARKAAECTHADLRSEWEELKKLDGRTLLVRELAQAARRIALLNRRAKLMFGEPEAETVAAEKQQALTS